MLTYNNPILQKDLKELSEVLSSVSFDGATILVAGANGMLASYLVFYFIFASIVYKQKIRLLLLARDGSKLLEKYKEFQSVNLKIIFLAQDVLSPIDFEGKVDYVLHFASNASPHWIENDPVGILKANILGTINLLNFAKKTGAKFILASTREVYGEVIGQEELRETTFGGIDCLISRSCYPESKRAAEALCMGYYNQFGVNFNVLRIAHVYGPGMNLSNDGRVMSDMLNAVVKKQDIILKSSGKAVRSFCYITDAVDAILRVMLKGESAKPYNLSNETEEISILALSKLIIKLFPNNGMRVVSRVIDNSEALYCNYQRVKLNTDTLKDLGWYPHVQLEEGIIRTVKSFTYEEAKP